MSDTEQPSQHKVLSLVRGSNPDRSVFAAIRVGSTTLYLTVAPRCSPGKVCPQYIATRVPLKVTVRG
ncbi:MAG: hypothetical protein ACRDPG_03440 [Nocardioidaceae bacterium]